MTLTREEILAMDNWRKLDGLVADKVMGFDMVEDTLPQLPKYYLPEYERTIQRDVPLYSSDISAAWEVVDKMNERDEHSLALEFYPNEKEWGADFDEFAVSSQAVSKTAPEAICKAALLAVLNL